MQNGYGQMKYEHIKDGMFVHIINAGFHQNKCSPTGKFQQYLGGSTYAYHSYVRLSLMHDLSQQGLLYIQS